MSKWYIGAPFMPKHAQEIGRVIALWSVLEHILDGMICQMAGIGLNAGEIFLYNVNMSTRISILEGIGNLYLKKHDPYLFKEILKTTKRIGKYRKRNELVHTNWIGTKWWLVAALSVKAYRKNPNPTYTFWTAQKLDESDTNTVKAIRKMRKHTKPLATVESIEEVGNEISDFIMEVRELAYGLNDVLPPPPLEHDPSLFKRSQPSRRTTSRRK